LAVRGVPAFAMFGQRSGLEIAGAGPDKLPALQTAVRRLLELGHRKISLLVRKELREPEPGPFAKTFLAVLENHGITINPAYNLPEWEESGDGMRRCLDKLFRHTPPSALILDEVILFHTAQAYLARKGIHAPEQVSLVCADPNPTFDWAEPTVAHIRWEPRDVAKRVVRWVDRIARGMEDMRQTLTKARFIEGGTIGPVPQGNLFLGGLSLPPHRSP
jgi:DNA-binding LacI/PurR family transcriptional regulator